VIRQPIPLCGDAHQRFAFKPTFGAYGGVDRISKAGALGYVRCPRPAAVNAAGRIGEFERELVRERTGEGRNRGLRRQVRPEA
jgi:hypothetical protein